MGNEMAVLQKGGCIPSQRSTTPVQFPDSSTGAEGLASNGKKSSLANNSFAYRQQSKDDKNSLKKSMNNFNKNTQLLKHNPSQSLSQVPPSSINAPINPQISNNSNGVNSRNNQKPDNLRNKNEAYLGDEIQSVCQFQAAEIERLATQINQHQYIFMQLKRRNVDQCLSEYFKQIEARFFNRSEVNKAYPYVIQKERGIQKQENINYNPKYKALQIQLAALKTDIFKLAIQNEQIKQSFQRVSKQKGQLQANFQQSKMLLQKASFNDSQKFKQYQQIISIKDIQIKRIRKRLKQRNLEIRALNYELQESQTNQYYALEDNQQLIIQLSKLNLPQLSFYLKSELQSILFKKSQLSKKEKEHQQSIKAKTYQNNNLLSVPGHQQSIKAKTYQNNNLLSVPGNSIQTNQTFSRIRPPSSRIRPLSSRQQPPSYRQINQNGQVSPERNPFLHVLQQVLPKNSTFKKNSSSMKTQHRQIKQIQNFNVADQPHQFKISQSKNLNNFVQAMQIELKGKRGVTAGNEANYIRTQSKLGQNCQSGNLEVKIPNAVGNYQTKVKRFATMPSNAYMYDRNS